MNTEIKFRGKALTGEWVYGFYIGQTKTHIASTILCDKTGKFVVVMAQTVGQYIGLKDKNKKESYKGDILKGSNGGDEFYGPIIWNQSTCSFVVDIKDEILHSLYDKFELEILGNIHENPELLEE